MQPPLETTGLRIPISWLPRIFLRSPDIERRYWAKKKKKIKLNIQNRQIHRDGKQISACQRLGERVGNYCLMGLSLLLGDENVPELEGGAGCTTL